MTRRARKYKTQPSLQRVINARIELIRYRLNDIVNEVSRCKADLQIIRDLVRPPEDVEPD